MSRKVLVDSSAVAALLCKTDSRHGWATRQSATLLPPFYTCEAVLSESLFLLRDSPSGRRNLIGLLQHNLIVSDFSLSDGLGRVVQLMKQYGNVPMSLADACLLCMAERDRNSIVFTLDSDFRIYRVNGRDPVPTLMPE